MLGFLDCDLHNHALVFLKLLDFFCLYYNMYKKHKFVDLFL